MTAAIIALGMFLAGYGAARMHVALAQCGGRHRVARVQKHRGWEGREDELSTFTAAFLIAREQQQGPVWPLSDVDRPTVRFEAVGHA